MHARTPSSRLLGLGLVPLLTLVLLGCGDQAETSPDAGAPDSGAPDVCASTDPATCEGEAAVRSCATVGGRLDWVVTPCDEGTTCSAGVCVTPDQLRQATMVRDYVKRIEERTACPAPIDWAALAEESAQRVLVGDGSDRAVFRALRHVHLEVPQGHQNLLTGACGEPGATPWLHSTWYGVCGRPSQGSVVVTSAEAGNTLGLAPGDRVVATSAWPGGAGFLEAIAAEPVCGSSLPSTSARIESAAASFFGLVEPGMTLTVRAPDGDERTVTAPARDAAFGWCIAPFGGYEDFEATVTVRADGIAVVRVPGFLSSAYPLPSPLTSASYQKWIDDYVERLRLAIEPVLAAPAIIWDARGNTGGSSEVALAIVGGMAGATTGSVSQGFQRIQGTSPFEFEKVPVASFSFEVIAGGPLTHTGKVAVLIDGGTYSAGDFFAYGAKHFSDALIVGRPAAGAYGYGGNAAIKVNGPPKFNYTVDKMRSIDADGLPLEGRSVEPDLLVEYDPADLAAGTDTVLEAAAKALLAP